MKLSIVVIDSFKVFDDLAKSHRSCANLVMKSPLISWRGQQPFGEYAEEELARNPVFSIVDGLSPLISGSAGEQQRFIQFVKMRGTAHSRDEHSFVMTSKGVEVLRSRHHSTEGHSGEVDRGAPDPDRHIEAGCIAGRGHPAWLKRPDCGCGWNWENRASA